MRTFVQPAPNRTEHRAGSLVGKTLWIGWVAAWIVWVPLALGKAPVPQPARQSSIPALTVGMNDDFPPYEFVDRNGHPTGYNIDLMRAIAQAMGFEVEFAPSSWTDAVAALRERRVDALAGMLRSDEREQWADFSSPIIIIQYSVFQRADAPVRPQADLFAGRTVLVERDSQMHDFMLSAHPECIVLPTRSEPDALLRLAAGEGDLAILPRLIGLGLIGERNFSNVVPLPGVIATRDMCIATPHGSDELVATFNTGLQILHTSGKQREIYELWFGHLVPSDRSLFAALRPVLWILLPLAGIAAAALLWSWVLRREVRLKTGELREELEESARIERELRENQRAMNLLIRNLPGMVYRCLNNRDWTMEFVSEGAVDLTGHTPQDILIGAPTFTEITYPDDRERVWQSVQDALASRTPFQIVYRITKKSGELRWVWEQGAGVYDESGNVIAIEGFITDMTDRISAERALQESEQRLELVLRGADLGLWDDNFLTGEAVYNDQWGAMLGYEPHEIEPRITEWDRLVHPDDREGVLDRFDRHVRGEIAQFEAEHRLRTKSGEWKWILTRGRVTERDESGKAVRACGTHLDVDDRKRAEQRQRLMMNELDHRVKNNLAAILSLADNTARISTTIDEFRDVFIGRVCAMARMHSLLARNRWSGMGVRELIRLTLEAYTGPGPDRVVIEGEDFVLPARAASPVNMTLHELATNAAKYGALSRPDGCVEVTWSIDRSENPHPTIEIHWTERGGPPVTPPTHRGFGMTLIEGAISHELSGSVNLVFHESGLSCRIRFPVPRRNEPRVHEEDSSARPMQQNTEYNHADEHNR